MSRKNDIFGFYNCKQPKTRGNGEFDTLPTVTPWKVEEKAVLQPIRYVGIVQQSNLQQGVDDFIS